MADYYDVALRSTEEDVFIRLDLIDTPILLSTTQGSIPCIIVGYTHTQILQNTTWIVNHNLGRYPYTVRVKSPGGVEVIANVTDVHINQFTVSFALPQTGSVEVL